MIVIVYVKELDGKKIVQIVSGQQHSLALDDTGCAYFCLPLVHSLSPLLSVHSFYSLCSVVYVWGYNGYCRLGLGNQVDILKPKPVPQVRRRRRVINS